MADAHLFASCCPVVQVEIVLRVLTRPDLNMLQTIFRNLGLDYDERVLPSITNEVLKAVVAQYNAEELLTKRDEVSAKIKQDLTKRARDFNLIIEDVAITHLQFGIEFSKAIEQKQVAEQEAERAKFYVERAEQEKKSAIIRAQGEAQSAKLIGQAIANNPSFITLRKIEAARHIGHVISRSQNRVFLNTDSLLLNLGDMKVESARGR